MATVCKWAAGEGREPIAAPRCTEQQHRPSGPCTDGGWTRDLCQKPTGVKTSSRGSHEIHGDATEQILREKGEALSGAQWWCHVCVPSQRAAGYQLPARALPAAVLADPAGASRMPGRRRAKSTPSPNKAPGGITATAVPPAAPSCLCKACN